MNNKYDKLSFLAYIHNPISRESMNVLYGSNNIRYEKCELYGDFVQSLLMLIFDTYMGDDIMDADDQIKHFDWCWNKNIENFKLEGIFFENHKLYDYFKEFMIEVYYSYENKKKFEYTDKSLIKIWVDIFNYNKIKTQSDIDTLIEVYNIFENSLKYS